MYVAVKGGEKAIDNAHRYLASERRGDCSIPELTLVQIKEQMSKAVSRVMAEGSLFDPDLASLAIKQSSGDLIEAIFLIRAYRTTLPRFNYSNPIKTENMLLDRRISATFKDLPGGQILGPTFDYTHRLLDFKLAAEGLETQPTEQAENPLEDEMPRVLEMLNNEGLIEETMPADFDDDAPVGDLTREPLEFPADRDLRLQNLARGDEGFILALGYSTQRGYARNHAFVGEIRIGDVAVEIEPEELGFSIDIGDINVTECETVNQFMGSKEVPPQFTRGYGLTFGQNERKTIAMALVDRALRCDELGEEKVAAVQDDEFVLSHSDNIQSTGFVEHIKLPHYVDFQSELELIRKLRNNITMQQSQAAE